MSSESGRAFRAVLAVASAGLLMFGCEPLGGKSRTDHLLTLNVGDSLSGFDTVRVFLLKPDTDDTLETIWDGHLDSSRELVRMSPHGYDGGSVDILIEADKHGVFSYRRLVHYRSGGAPTEEVVLPSRPPPAKDTTAPVITLTGADSLAFDKGKAFRDPGASCHDDHDGDLAVAVLGAVDTGAPALYVLTYSCSDSAGNRSAPKSRKVLVKAPPDTTPARDTVPPVITRIGSDSMRVGVGGMFTDPGASCVDGRDGSLAVTTQGSVNVTQAGDYRLKYLCADKSGNRDSLVRVVEVFTLPKEIHADKESMIDTLDLARNPNQGFSGVLGFSRYSSDRFFPLIHFAPDTATPANFKTAKLRFHTYAYGGPWPDTALPLTFRAYALDSDWAEGTGNWYFFGGQWRNGGDTLLENYLLPDYVVTGSTSPLAATGVAPEDKALVRASNVVLVATQTLAVAYAPRNRAGKVPAVSDLVTVEMDVGAYVRGFLNAHPTAQNHGVMVSVEGLPPGAGIGFLTKEIEDGSLGPVLRLDY